MAAPDPSDNRERLSNGWIVVADIVGYSLKSDAVQRDIATFLMRAVESTFLYRRFLQRSASYSIACTGDGFILALADEVVVGEEQTLLRFVEEIQALVKAYGQCLASRDPQSCDPDMSPDRKRQSEFSVRLGLHRGLFAFEEILGQRNAIGTGLNLAVRIAGHGDAGHILASREFVDAINRTSTVGPGQFFASLGEAGVKHGLGLPVFSYFREVDGVVVYGSRQNTRAGERQRSVDELIIKRLSEITAKVAALLQKHDPDLTSRRTGLRLTLLAPTLKREFLAVTRYRYLSHEPPATTDAAYVIDGLNKAEGVSARAYVTGEPSLITKLPDRHTSFEDYCAQLKTVGLKEDTIRQFRRPCRAFVAVPVQLPVSNEVRLVLTLDSLEPLFEPESPKMQEVVATLTEESARIALLIELKQPLPCGERGVRHAE